MRYGRITLAGVPVLMAALLIPTMGAGAAVDYEAQFEFTVVPLVPGQPLGIAFVATHWNKKTGLFKPKKVASEGLQQLAESGSPAFFQADLATREDRFPTHAGGFYPVVAGGVVGAMYNPSVSRFQMSVPTTVPFVSAVAKLMCTNDGFAGARNVRLPKKKGQMVVVKMQAFDAGSETNTEVSTDLVPQCAEFANPDKTPGTDEPQPELDEGGKVVAHPGIQGSADLSPSLHGWDGPVAYLIIEHIGRAPGPQ